MRKLYVCPNCGTAHSGVASAYEDGGGDYGDEYTPIFDCFECGKWFTGGEGFIGWEGKPDDNPNDDIPLDNKPENNPPPIQIDIDRW